MSLTADNTSQVADIMSHNPGDRSRDADNLSHNADAMSQNPDNVIDCGQYVTGCGQDADNMS